MKAMDLKMEELLEFRPQEGKVFFKGARTLVFNADAFGTLRRDLIHNLGFDRAKGFLIRYGWQLGYNDGISIKENFDWDSDEESFIAGSVLFTLEGFAKVENDFISIDREKNTFLKKGRFINSFEAEQHIRYFGLNDRAVCWMLIGYAGGYGSAYMGEKVYYKETKCRGKGDPDCEFEGKTLTQWGESIYQELPYYEDKSISEELENAYKRIQEQNRQLERSLIVHEELYQLVLRGEGLTGITQTISRIINGGILLFDNKLKILAFNQGLDQIIIKEFRNVLTKYLDEILSLNRKLENHIKLVNRILPHKIHVSLNGIRYACVILPIIAGDDILGYVSAIHENCSEMEPESLILLQRTTDIYAVDMMKQKQMLDLEQQFRADFIETLFTQKYSNIDSLVAWGERLGQNILVAHYVLVMEIDYCESNKMSSEKILLLRKEVLHSTNKLLTQYFSSVMCVDLKEKIVVLIPAELTTSKDFIKKIVKIITERVTYLKSTVSFGIGGIVYQVADYNKSYLQACKALKVIRSFNKKERVLFFDELGSISILLDAQDNNNLLEFMEQKLKPLLDYDTNNNSELLTTLEHYLSTESIRKATQFSNLSLSGLKYRLNKIRDFGYDLQSPDELFELQLAVRIYKLFQ